VFVHSSIIDNVAERLSEGASKLKVGNATEESTEVGPLILPGEVDRVDNWVQEAVDKGAKLLAGGKKLSKTTYAPTIILNPPLETKVSTMEIFGPVMCLYPYTDRLMAIESANSLNMAFQAAVYTNDLTRRPLWLMTTQPFGLIGCRLQGADHLAMVLVALAILCVK
jgi:acyl-CoA reductase-like NAD-dependent aldehyde dehydrogenase